MPRITAAKGVKPAKHGAKKSGRKDGVKLIPQAHGGALLPGGQKGQNPGPGRPKDAVRAELVNVANGQGIPFLKDLMRGEVRYRLVGKCEKCGHEAPALGKGETDELWVNINASIDHRIKGLDTSLKYGIGTKDEVELDVTSDPKVRRLVSNLAQATIEIFGQSGYLKLSKRVKELEAN